MNREQQEMTLWRRVFDRWYSREDYESDTCGDIADVAVAEFRKRYSVEPAADNRLGSAAIAAMDAIIEVMGDEDQSNQHKAAAIDRIATQYVAARWHIQKETGK